MEAAGLCSIGSIAARALGPQGAVYRRGERDLRGPLSPGQLLWLLVGRPADKTHTHTHDQTSRFFKTIDR
eukprot:4498902-Amphidinium_carterae.1